jgi:hypothetical protein
MAPHRPLQAYGGASNGARLRMSPTGQTLAAAALAHVGVRSTVGMTRVCLQDEVYSILAHDDRRAPTLHNGDMIINAEKKTKTGVCK